MGRKTVMNNLTDAESIAAVCSENKSLKNDFLSYLRSTGHGESTIRTYTNDLDIAFVWCLKNNGNKPFTEWSKRNILAYQNWLVSENGNGAARVRRLKATLSSLSNYIENVLDDEYPNFRNIVHKIENPPMKAAREKTVLSDEEVNDLLAQLVEADQPLKACVVALAMFSGRRKSELLRFRVSDFNDDHLVCGGALYKSDPIVTKGRGGGKVINCYTLAKKFKPYFDRWIEERKERGIESEWLFPSPVDSARQMSINVLDRWTDEFSARTGKPFYFHSLRHAFTTSLVRAGIPDNVIQSIVAWESADMVRVYTDIDADEAIGMYFKDGDIVAADKKTLSDL